MYRIQTVAIGIAFLVAASPAFAGATHPTPAPIAGIGIGAVALIGLGYRALKRRINP